MSAAAPEKLTCTSVAKAAGIAPDTAWRRLKKYQAGLISREALFAPPRRGGGRHRTPDAAVVDAIIASTGLSRAAAWDRLRQVKLGNIPDRLLFAATSELRAWRGEQRRGQYTPRECTSEWGDLGLGPRKRTQDIPGGTAWERTHLGR